jgi:hypothetical protein
MMAKKILLLAGLIRCFEFQIVILTPICQLEQLSLLASACKEGCQRASLAAKF